MPKIENPHRTKPQMSEVQVWCRKLGLQSGSRFPQALQLIWRSRNRPTAQQRWGSPPLNSLVRTAQNPNSLRHCPVAGMKICPGGQAVGVESTRQQRSRPQRLKPRGQLVPITTAGWGSVLSRLAGACWRVCRAGRGRDSQVGGESTSRDSTWNKATVSSRLHWRGQL